MSPRVTGRTQKCGPQDARTRLNQAQAFLEVAELVGEDDDQLATHGVAAALAVLAGIAASDATCCRVLGRRSRGQDHRRAVELLVQVEPDGPTMARDLERLLAVKDDAHYGLLNVGAQRTKAALRQAHRLVDAAAAHIV